MLFFLSFVYCAQFTIFNNRREHNNSSKYILFSKLYMSFMDNLYMFEESKYRHDIVKALFLRHYSPRSCDVKYADIKIIYKYIDKVKEDYTSKCEKYSLFVDKDINILRNILNIKGMFYISMFDEYCDLIYNINRIVNSITSSFADSTIEDNRTMHHLGDVHLTTIDEKTRNNIDKILELFSFLEVPEEDITRFNSFLKCHDNLLVCIVCDSIIEKFLILLFELTATTSTINFDECLFKKDFNILLYLMKNTTPNIDIIRKRLYEIRNLYTCLDCFEKVH